MGEQQAAEKLVEAGRIPAQEPQAMLLRYFAALHDVAGERSSTVVFPACGADQRDFGRLTDLLSAQERGDVRRNMNYES